MKSLVFSLSADIRLIDFGGIIKHGRYVGRRHASQHVTYLLCGHIRDSRDLRDFPDSPEPNEGERYDMKGLATHPDAWNDGFSWGELLSAFLAFSLLSAELPRA